MILFIKNSRIEFMLFEQKSRGKSGFLAAGNTNRILVRSKVYSAKLFLTQMACTKAKQEG